jgi:branched-chain amino acid aminotransferase
LRFLYIREKGWDKPHIKPYQNLSIDPSAPVFHYALEVYYFK